MLNLSDLTTLALFADVVEHGSLTRAAKTSGLAKATVSRRMTELERRLGVRLLQRSTRRVVPTEEGKRLYARCSELVGAAKAATEVMLDAAGAPGGTLRVAAPTVFAQLHLTPIVVDYLAKQANVQVQVLSNNTPVDLIADEIDVAIRVGSFPDSALMARRLALDPIVAVASNKYLKRHGTPETLRDLGAHACLRLSWEAERPRWDSGQQSATGRRPHLVATDGAVVREAAMLGLGIAFLPSHAVAADVRAGRLVRVLEQSNLPVVPIHVVYPERRQLTARVREFVDHLVEHFTRREWRDRALLEDVRSRKGAG